MSTTGTAALVERATAWRDDDPDDATRAELDDVLGRVAAGDAAAEADLADRFSGLLEFGTAGLRGALGAGPHRMNRAVVLRAAAGLTAYLQERTARPRVVIGYDARHNSDVFARDTAAVVVAAGGTAMVLPRPLPTPVLAFAIRHLGADAGVMVTASHNPPQDNGYKVYLGDGSQIVPPADSGIAAAISRLERVADIARAADGWEVLGEQVLERYVEAAAAVVDPQGPRDLAVVHTSLHGVGNEVVARAFARAGFAAPTVVTTQAEPDPAFPTVSFPNPEEPGAIDAALALAAQVGADLVLANDPDADRCAAAVPDPACVEAANPGGWRMLRGDEVGALLGAHILSRGVDPGAVLRQLDRVLPAARGAGGRGRRAPRGDAHRVQVDRARARAALRLRGGARLLRRPGVGAGQGRRHRGPAARGDGGGPAGAGTHAAGRAGRPRRRPRGARHRRPLGAGRGPVADRDGAAAAALGPARADRRGGGPAGRRPGPAGRPGCRPPRGCATTSPTTAGSSSGPAAPSPS